MGDFQAGLVDFFDDVYGDTKARAGVSLARESPNGVERMEHDPLPGTRQMTEQTMFNRIVLRAIRREVSDTNTYPQPI